MGPSVAPTHGRLCDLLRCRLSLGVECSANHLRSSWQADGRNLDALSGSGGMNADGAPAFVSRSRKLKSFWKALALSAVQGTGAAGDSDEPGGPVDRKAQRHAVSQIHAKADFTVGDGGGGRGVCDVNQLILLVKLEFPHPASVVGA